VVKEEIRVRKDVGEEEEVIEEDVRKEEIDVEDFPHAWRQPRGDSRRRRGQAPRQVNILLDL
jgi:stress response protein YsnF